MHTASTSSYTLSLHDALPICDSRHHRPRLAVCSAYLAPYPINSVDYRSEEHTSELQSRGHLVCRLLLEKKNVHLCVRCWADPAAKPVSQGAGRSRRWLEQSPR